MDECDCGYCGKCREQYQHEVDTQDKSCYENKEDSDTEPEVWYWRV